MSERGESAGDSRRRQLSGPDLVQERKISGTRVARKSKIAPGLTAGFVLAAQDYYSRLSFSSTELHYELCLFLISSTSWYMTCDRPDSSCKVKEIWGHSLRTGAELTWEDGSRIDLGVDGAIQDRVPSEDRMPCFWFILCHGQLDSTQNMKLIANPCFSVMSLEILAGKHRVRIVRWSRWSLPVTGTFINTEVPRL